MTKAIKALISSADRLVFSPRFWLSTGNTDRLRYLVLGSTIKDELSVQIPSIQKYTRHIDMPYFYKDADESTMLKDGIVRFGSFGVGNVKKGTYNFFRLAKDIEATETRSASQFILIGHIVHGDLEKMSSGSVFIPSPHSPLSDTAYEKYARSIDYAVFFQDKAHYMMTAMATLFDAFSFLKPIIGIRTPFLDYYFNIMGDIGYRCDTYDDVKATITEILNHKPIDRYSQQRNNILEGRKRFDTTELARTLADIW